MQLLFKPSVWHSCEDHDWRTCTIGVNCYAYALNRPEYYWAVPGHGFAKAMTQQYHNSFNAYFNKFSQGEFRERLIAGAERDGLIATTKPQEKEGYYLAALFFPDDPNNFDFHWYRRDDNGTWSHKDGWRMPKNKDIKGNVLRDPRADAQQSYPVFGGFFLVPRKGIHLTQTFPLPSKKAATAT